MYFQGKWTDILFYPVLKNAPFVQDAGQRPSDVLLENTGSILSKGGGVPEQDTEA